MVSAASVVHERAGEVDSERGSLAQNMGCFYGKPGFDSKHPCGDSQASVNPVPKDLVPCFGL